MNVDLELCQELQGHEKAVRCVCALSNGQIASGGVDNLVCLWKTQAKEDDPSKSVWVLDKKLQHHNDFIYALADNCGGSSSSSSGGHFYTGSKEKLIFKVDYEGNPIMQFVGHEGPVCSLVERSDTELVSGSWDGTCRVWNTADGALKMKIDAGTHAISVCPLPTGEIATGSQEATVKVWATDGSLKATLSGHADIVRKVLYNPKASCLLTCSNDQAIKMWSVDGLEMQSLQGHDGFVFDILLGSNGDFTNLLYSAADDRQLKIWNLDDSTVKQSILHANTVWGVATLANGDVITACADGGVRIWTNDKDRMAPDDLKQLQQDQAMSAAAEASKQGASAVPMANVPDANAMGQGKKIGEVKMGKVGGTVNAYSWNGREWDLIGEVTGRSKATYAGDQFFPAGDYDFLFDVEVGEGGRTAKLPYNEGDNMLVTSEKFCAREGIHKSMLDQITQFLRTQTGGGAGAGAAPTLGQQSGNGSAPTPAPSSAAASSAASGSGNYKHFPVSQMVFIDAAKFEPLKNKLKEYNAEFPSDQVPDPCGVEGTMKYANEHKIDPVEWMHMMEGIEKIEKNMIREDMRPIQRDLMWKRMGGWPTEKLMPVLDLWRLHLLHPSSTDVFKGTDKGYSHIVKVLSLLKADPSGVLAVACARVLVNLFRQQTNKQSAMDRRKEILEGISGICNNTPTDKIHKLVKVAFGTCLLNFSIEFATRKEKDVMDFVLCAQAFLTKANDEKESCYRVLAAVGNLLAVCGPIAGASDALKAGVEKVKGLHGSEAKVKDCADEVLKVLGA